MRRCGMHIKRQFGCVLSLGGVLLVFVCLPMEFFLIALGTGMTVIGIAMLNG